MTAPDLALARRFLEAEAPPGRVLVCAITGSHQYGFSSPDSDLDIKGIHLAPTRDLLGLGRPPESHDRLAVFEGVECDLTTNEAGLALSLLLKGNGNILERLFSPWQVVTTPALEPLRALARASLSTACFGHYAGYFRGMQREHLRQDPPRAKSLLYTWRVALTGAHLLRTGEVEGNLLALAPRYGLPEAEELAQIKREGHEKQPLSPAQAERFRAVWPRLEGLLQDAFDHSVLPAAPPDREALSRWLVEARVASLEDAP